jgi:uncharacterized protein YndB with AHSA1/START domain
MAITFRMQIAAPADRVFDYVSDVANHPEWANPKANLRMDQVSGVGPALGARYHSEQVFVGKKASADIDVTAFERPSRFAFRLTQHVEGKRDSHFEHDFRFLPNGGGTTVERHITSDGNPVVGFIAYPAIRSDAMKALNNLKAKLETGLS